MANGLKNMFAIIGRGVTVSVFIPYCDDRAFTVQCTQLDDKYDKYF